jgi:sarcosine oxidase subunit beta
MRYSVSQIIKQGLTGNRGWTPVWREPDPKPRYDIVIVGGGGHGIATAYYLAKMHGLTDVAVLEKGWLGSGNIGRNTTIVRSNYLLPGNEPFYELSMKLWEGLEQELNYNVMVSQRGIVNLFHSDPQRDAAVRRGNAMILAGADAVLLDREALRRKCPFLDFDNERFPIKGGLWQPRGGTVRHDAVAWGYARAADARGVDIVQNCEVTGIDVEAGRVTGVQTTQGAIAAKKVGIVVAGHSSVLAAMAGFRLPIESHPLQALVSEPLKPVLHCVIMSNGVHVYVSQSDKGELVIGAGLDPPNSYSQRGGLHTIEDQMGAIVELIPIFSRVRMMRSWAGIVDVCPDASPIIGKTPVEGLFINGGWGTGGFKATPGSGWVLAHTIATGAPHPLNAPFALNRFVTGRLVDEHGAAGVAH